MKPATDRSSLFVLPGAYATLLQPVLEAWAAHPAVDFPNYPAGSWGSESAEGLISRDRGSWLAPSLPESGA